MKPDWHINPDAGRRVMKNWPDPIPRERDLSAPQVAEALLRNTVQAIRDSVRIEVAFRFAKDLPYALRCFFYVDGDPANAIDAFVYLEALWNLVRANCERERVNQPREIIFRVIRLHPERRRAAAAVRRLVSTDNSTRSPQP